MPRAVRRRPDASLKWGAEHKRDRAGASPPRRWLRARYRHQSGEPPARLPLISLLVIVVGAAISVCAATKRDCRNGKGGAGLFENIESIEQLILGYFAAAQVHGGDSAHLHAQV